MADECFPNNKFEKITETTETVERNLAFLINASE